MQIPKDGRSYLAWHSYYGFRFVMSGHERVPVLKDGLLLTSDQDAYIDSFVGLSYGDGKEFIRWMDEHGQWHETH
jgi:hypothetical protein